MSPASLSRQMETPQSPEAMIYVIPALRACQKYLNGTRVLDFGCGTGNYAPFYRTCGVFELVGIDASSQSISIARADHSFAGALFLNRNPFHSDLSDLRLFDVVLLLWTVHFLPEDVSIESLARRVATLVRSGGRVVMLAQFPSTSGRYQPFTRLDYPGLSDGMSLPEVRVRAPFVLLDAMLQPMVTAMAWWPRLDDILKSFSASGLNLVEQIPLGVKPDGNLPSYLQHMLISFRPPPNGEKEPTRLLVFRKTD